jgi:hypothetical protein
MEFNGDTEKACNAPVCPQTCRQPTLESNQVAKSTIFNHNSSKTTLFYRILTDFQLIVDHQSRPFSTNIV